MNKQKITGFFKAILHFPRKVLMLPIKFYRRFISPLKGSPSCRFTPSCSEYALEAINEWGVIAGLALAVWRVLRCNPFGGHGHDPVPKRTTKKVSRDTENKQ